ncbi:MAG: BF3164 family lipoprotein [Bacteroidales bacterium]
MNRWPLFLVALCGVIASCENKDKRLIEFSFDTFLRQVELKAHVMGDNEIPLKGGTLLFIDTTFVLTNAVSGSSYFHFFGYSDLTYKGSGGIIGQGPGEIINPFAAIPDAAGKGIWCMDRGRNELLYYPLDSLLADPSFLPEVHIPLPDVQYIIVSYQTFNDSLFSFFSCDPDILVSFFDFCGRVREEMNIPDLIHEGYFDPRNPCKVTFLYSINPYGERIAVCDRFSDVLYIAGSKGELLKKLVGPGKIMADITALDIESESTFWGLKSDKKYIYGLYLGKSRVENKSGYYLPVFPRRLLIFDWDGNALFDILFEFSVSSFYPDYQKRRIVTFSPDHARLVVYEMPREL